MVATLEEYEQQAQQRLVPAVSAFLKAGSEDELTLKANESAFSDLKLMPKVLTGIDKTDITTSLLGQKTLPILAAPFPFQTLFHPQGELETANAMKQLDTLMLAPTYSTTCLSKLVFKKAPKPWFQLYFLKNRHWVRELVSRVETFGYSAIVVTVDLPVYPQRDREIKKPLDVSLCLPTLAAIDPAFNSIQTQALSELLDPSINWEAIEWLKANTRLPIILKGILCPADAYRAKAIGVDGIIVSNHGGRQLDTAPSAVECLPQIRQQVDDMLLLMDGGIRRGTDVLKAIALGANGVCLARPIAWGLAVKGSEGIVSIVERLARELSEAMLMCGYSTIQSIGSDCLLNSK